MALSTVAETGIIPAESVNLDYHCWDCLCVGVVIQTCSKTSTSVVFATWRPWILVLCKSSATVFLEVAITIFVFVRLLLVLIT